MAQETKKYFSDANRALSDLKLARESNTEYSLATTMNSYAKRLTESTTNSLLMLGGVISVFGVDLVVNNEPFAMYSGLATTLVGGLAIGESTKIASRLYRRRVRNNGLRDLNQSLKQIGSSDIQLGIVRDAIRDQMALGPEKPLKAGEVTRWVKQDQIRKDHLSDPRVGMAYGLDKRVKYIYGEKKPDVTVVEFMRAQAEAYEIKGRRASISREAARLGMDLAIGEAVGLVILGTMDYFLGKKFGVLGSAADDIVTFASLALLTPAKRVFTGETAHEAYGKAEDIYKKIAFWKREVPVQETIRLLEGPKIDSTTSGIVLEHGEEIVIGENIFTGGNDSYTE